MKKIRRNDPCSCGSGKKYKQCCGSFDEAQAAKMLTVDAPSLNIFQAALEHHQGGRLPQAEVLCLQILQVAPNHPDALHLSGLIAYQMGKSNIAVELISRAIYVNPLNPMYYGNLGNAFKALGKLDVAVESFNKVISLKPDSVEAHINLGATFQEQGKLDKAVVCYLKAISINPKCADAHSNLGDAFREQGKLDAAVESYLHALVLNPNCPVTHSNQGNVLKEQGKLDKAVACYLKAISINPDYAETHYNLGNVFRETGQMNAAAESYRHAISLNPAFAKAHSNLGNALKELGKLDEAIVSYRKALSIKPNYAGAYSNLLFLHGYHASLDPHEYLSLARGWEQACLPEQDRRAAHGRVFQRRPPAGRRLRVGYVSGDYRQHAVSYFVEQLFTHHDRSRLELFAYSNHGIRDAVTDRLRVLVDHWIPIAGMSDTAVLDRIESDGIDVLVDLSGHTAHNRQGVFARRAAPVQAHYLGYFASTGLTEMDYWIGDEILTPPETDSHFSEQVWRLPQVWVSYKTIADAPESDWRPASDGSVWVGSFNNLGKLTPQTITLWAKVLHALPEGRLLLKTKELADAGNCQRILDAMADHGISPDRIELQRNTEWADYMAHYNRLDIALDPVGAHGGGTTTCDALWMGVPVIHALGNCATSRFTASMLNSIGHPEWIARSEAEYVEKVVALARDVEHRKVLRSTQRGRMAGSPLCNAKDLATNLENAYVEMFERWMQRRNERTTITSQNISLVK